MSRHAHRRWLLALGLAVGVAGACRKKSAPAPVSTALEPLESPERPPAAGVVANDVFTDTRYGMSVALPPGWLLDVGADDADLRAALYNPETDVRVELRVYELPEDQDLPPDRDGCSWIFYDLAPYRALRLDSARGAATCRPEQAGGPLVFAYLARKSTTLLSVEVIAGPTGLAGQKAEGDRVVRGVRW